MSTIVFAATALLLAVFLAVLLFRLPKATRDRIRVTTIWVSGLFSVFVIGVLWLALLGLAIYSLYRPHGGKEVAGYVFVFAFLLMWLGFVFVDAWHLSPDVNRILKELDEYTGAETGTNAQAEKLASDFSYDQQRASYLAGQFDALVDNYQREVSLEFSETYTLTGIFWAFSLYGDSGPAWLETRFAKSPRGISCYRSRREAFCKLTSHALSRTPGFRVCRSGVVSTRNCSGFDAVVSRVCGGNVDG